MAKLGINDLLTFAKSGWTPAAVKEIMALDKSAEEAPESTAKESESTEVQNAQEGKPEDLSETKEEVPDYKKLYEDTQKQIDDLNNKLAAAQKANTMTDVSKSVQKKSTQETVNDIFKNVIS